MAEDIWIKDEGFGDPGIGDIIVGLFMLVVALIVGVIQIIIWIIGKLRKRNDRTHVLAGRGPRDF